MNAIASVPSGIETVAVLTPENPLSTPGDDRLSRRSFLKKAGLAAAVTGFPTIVPSSVFGANAPSNRIAMAGIGMGSQGTSNMMSFLPRGEVQWVAVCDVDSKRLAKAKSRVDANNGNDDCAVYADYRELLQRTDLDAISMATPDHWHALTATAAARAGLDVYGEKPLTHDLREGRILVDTLERYGRVWQTGSWQRSIENFHHASELVRNGRIGKVVRVEVGLPDGSDGPVRPIEPVPPELDWNMWLGPAAWQPYRGVAHWDWRWVLDWGGGQLVDWIGHHLDVAHWALDLEKTGPVEISGTGTFPEKGVFNAPIKYSVDCRYADGLTINVANASSQPKGMGTRWIGEDGKWIWVRREDQETNPPGLWRDVIGPEETRLYYSRDHQGNFLECVKSRRPSSAPAENAHRSASVGHLGLLAILVGRTIRWDPATETIINDPGASAMLGRTYREPWSLA
jgi:predicted dehydrogenase